MASRIRWSQSNPAALIVAMFLGLSLVALAGCGAGGGSPIDKGVVSPSITTASLPNGSVGIAYSVTIQTANSSGTQAWSIAAGALPGGLSLDPKTGAITGTPTANGTFHFTVSMTDSGGTATAALAISIVNPLTITTTSPLPNGAVGVQYSQTFAATGGTPLYTWSVSGGTTLPAGLSLSSAGTLSGIPTASGTFNFTVQALDSGSPAQATVQNFSITIAPPAALVITTASPMASGLMGQPYSQQLAFTGGTPAVTWTLSGGTLLPAGLNLSAGGLISGTPTTAGTTNFTVQAADSGSPQQVVTKNLSITINAAPLVITTASPMPSGVANQSYSQQLTSSGGTPAITWTLSGGTLLPAGLNLSAGGLISGTPTTAATTNFTVQAADSGSPQQVVTKSLSITIASAPPTLVITTSSPLPSGVTGNAYSQQLASTGGTGTVTWALSGGTLLPPGLSLSSAGLISGTPTTAATTNFTVQAADSGSPQQVVTRSYSVTINAAPPPLAIQTTSFPAATQGVFYTQTAQATGGTSPYTWSIAAGSLPAGLGIDPSTGVISGTPTGTGLANFTLQVDDAASASTSVNTSINVNASGPTPEGVLYVSSNLAGAVYSFNVASTLNGTPAPDRTLSGSNTKLESGSPSGSPYGMTVNGALDQLYVANAGFSVLGLVEFDSASTATGNIAPTRTLSGSNTGFDAGVKAVAVNFTTNVLFMGTSANGIRIFDNASTVSGNTAPNRTLSGGATGLQFVVGLFADSTNDRLYVANASPASILIWNSASTVNGNSPPTRTLSGAATTLSVPRYALVDTTRDKLYVAEASTGSILIWDNASTVNGNVAPTRVISGANTQIVSPAGLALDPARDELYVGTLAQTGKTILVFGSISSASGNVSPSRTITVPGAAAAGVTLDTTRQ